MRLLNRVYAFCAIALAIALAGIVAPAQVEAWTCWFNEATQEYNLRQLYYWGSQGDWWYNYDFESRNVSESNVDWPVNIVFWDNASDEILYDLYYTNWGWTGIAWPMEGRTGDGGSSDQWLSDTGLKQNSPVTPHFRAYGATFRDIGWSLYNTEFSYYVVATAHRDSWEIMPWGWSGRSEDAEGMVVQTANDHGYSFEGDALNGVNYEPDRTDPGYPDHVWDNNGSISKVRITA